jgi:hypothetical protein
LACWRARAAQVLARRICVSGERGARSAGVSAVTGISVRLARGARPGAPGPRPCFAARAAASRSAQPRGGLPGQDRHPPAHPGQRLLERLGLHGGVLVLRPRLAARAVLGDPGAGAPPVLADVLVPRAPDPALELDGRVLVQRGELRWLGLGHQQPLGVVERRQQGCIHRLPRSGFAAGMGVGVGFTCRAPAFHPDYTTPRCAGPRKDRWNLS